MVAERALRTLALGLVSMIPHVVHMELLDSAALKCSGGPVASRACAPKRGVGELCAREASEMLLLTLFNFIQSLQLTH